MAWHYTYDIHTVQEVRNNLMDISWHDTSLMIFIQIVGLKDVGCFEWLKCICRRVSAASFLAGRLRRQVSAGTFFLSRGSVSSRKRFSSSVCDGSFWLERFLVNFTRATFHARWWSKMISAQEQGTGTSSILTKA